MRIHYQWTEDGSVEICEYQQKVISTDAECHHCLATIPHGSKCAVLLPQDSNEIWLLHLACAEKGMWEKPMEVS